MEGVLRTSVGYAGGTKKNPTYYNLGDHSETVQIEYDPEVITYQDLLSVFWASHTPVYPLYSNQYKSVIFYHNEEQRILAQKTLEVEEARIGQNIYTEIVPYTEYYLAEDYHQKYYLRLKPEIAGYYEAVYPDVKDFIASTAVARVNGYLGGYGDLENLKQYYQALGLSKESYETMLRLLAGANSYCAQ